MTSHTFGTAINCMDGRVQEPVAKWLKENFSVTYVDMITEPGPDLLMTTASPAAMASLKAKAEISVVKHGSRVIALAGHYDCAANTSSPEEHREQIRQGVEAIQAWGLEASVVGLWVNEAWEVEQVT